MSKKMTDKKFKEFSREIDMLMQKYNIKIRRGSLEIVFGLEGSIITNMNCHIERECCIAFTEILTTQQAKIEKENGILIV